MRPQKQISAILNILFDAGGCIACHFGEVPDVVSIASLDVAQPEEHAIVLDVGHGVDRAEIDILTIGIVLVEPQPGAGFIVIAISNEFLGRGIFREEGWNLAANLCRSHNGQGASLVVLGDDGGFPALFHLYVLQEIGRFVDGGRNHS